MKVACFVSPLVHQRGPCLGLGWSEFLARLLQSLHQEAQCDCLLITGVWFKEWAIEHGKAQLLTGIRLVLLDEVRLYRQIRRTGILPTALDSILHEAEGEDLPALRIIADAIARQADGFEADVVIGFAGAANCVSALWPRALRLHIERGHFAKDPYPYSIYFDHLGIHGRSAIAQVDGRDLAYPVTHDGRALVSAFRSVMTARLRSLDPFTDFDLRGQFERVFLLPLQISNEVFFDAQSNYRTQFEFLYDVLAATPADVGVVVTEHPSIEPILRRTGLYANLDLLRRSFPNMIFFEESRLYKTPSQFLVPRVDGVWTVSSSIGHQALLFDSTIGSPAGTEISHFADATTFAAFFDRLGQRHPNKSDALLAWLLERYIVPETIFSDGRWLKDYLERRIVAAGSAANPIDGFVEIADADRLMAAWTAPGADRPLPKADLWKEDVLPEEMLAERAALRDERDAMLNSTSWRLTAPLRALKRAATGWRADAA
jgi:hypothetical protein